MNKQDLKLYLTVVNTNEKKSMTRRDHEEVRGAIEGKISKTLPKGRGRSFTLQDDVLESMEGGRGCRSTQETD